MLTGLSVPQDLSDLEDLQVTLEQTVQTALRASKAHKVLQDHKEPPEPQALKDQPVPQA